MELSDGEVYGLEQSETKLVAAVPTPEDGENFIIGMALDYSNQVGGWTWRSGDTCFTSRDLLDRLLGAYACGGVVFCSRSTRSRVQPAGATDSG